jgi:hypothetical protein
MTNPDTPINTQINASFYLFIPEMLFCCLIQNCSILIFSLKRNVKKIILLLLESK